MKSKNFITGLSANNKYLAQSILDDAVEYVKHNDVTCRPLVKAFYGFDFSYEYSDSADVYSVATRHKERLLAELEDSTDFTTLEKSALTNALNNLHGHKVIREAFPEVLAHAHDIDKYQFIVSLDNKVAEARITNLLAILGKLSNLGELTKVSELFGDFYVKTDFTGDKGLEYYFNKINLSPAANELIKEVLAEVTVEDLNWLAKVSAATTTWLPVIEGHVERFSTINIDNAYFIGHYGINAIAVKLGENCRIAIPYGKGK